MTQADAVVQVVKAVFPNTEVIPETTDWSEQQKEMVYSLLMDSYKEGMWDKKSGGKDEVSVMKYIPGLVNNHVRKDKRLNGGTEYEPKRPGSRQGTGDKSIAAMKSLLSLTTDPVARSLIQGEITKRLEEIKPKVEIVVDDLPEALRHLVK